MKKAKRILSFLMAVVIMSSFLSVVASAKAPYKDAAIPASQYDDHDKPSFTLDQCSSMTLDFLDKMLKDMNDKDGSLIIDTGIIGVLDLSSIDNALDSIFGLTNGSLWSTAQGLLGDLGGLNFTAINVPRRRNTPVATADTNVIYALVQFLSDNKTIISQAIDGTLDMGLVNSFVDLSEINVNQMLKESLFKKVYPDVDPVPEPVTTTMDQMVQDLITGLFVGTTEKPGIAPALAPFINIVGSTAPAYDFAEDLLANVYNIILVPLLNVQLKKVVRELCGVVYDPLNENDPGNESNLNEYAQLLDINYTVPAHTFATGTTFVSELNNIFFEIIDAVTLTYTGWVAGDNTKALDNLTAATKYIFGLLGNSVFKEFVETATQQEIDEMNYQQLFSYVLRSFLNGSIRNINIPSDADSLVEVAWYALKEVCAQYIPQIDYAAQPKTLNGVLYMLADFAVYGLNQLIDMNPASGSLPGQGLLAYGLGLDTVLLKLVDYVRINYGGLLNLTLSQTSGWAALDTIMFSVINPNWLPSSVGGSTKELFVNRLLRDIMDLNTTNLFALFDHRADSELASKTIKKILIDTVAKLLNVVFPATLGNYTTFDQIITNTELKGIVERLLTALYNRRAPILQAILPLLTNLMGLSSPQEFANPELAIPNQIGKATTFAINNESMGLNTGATNKSGTFTQDSLYKIKIVEITTNIPAITPTNLAGQTINGGESLNCTLSGTFAEGGKLVVTMRYDVYTELNTKLTETPLTAMAFSYISNSIDDGRNFRANDSNANNKHTSYYKSVYLNQNDSLSDLADAQFQFRRDKTDGHDLDATISRTAATVHPALVGVTAAPFSNISTNKDGGLWNSDVFVVDPEAVRPANGAYTSTFSYKATPTKAGVGDDIWAHSGKSYVVFYDDFGLPALFRSEVNKRRDPANYADEWAWEAYMAEMENAVSLVYAPRKGDNFMIQVAMAFEYAMEDLEDAIAALEESELAAGVTIIKNAMESVKPSNEGLEYDDPAYSYIGIADYVPYTYLNYEREEDNCGRLYNSQQLPKKPVLPVDATQEQITQYNADIAQWNIDLAQAQANMVTLKGVDISYALHRLNLYASRMIRVPAVKARLNETTAAITAAGNLSEGQYTTLSWAAFQKAYNFAMVVSADTDVNLRQTKVNTARETLIETYKQLVRVADYTQLLAELAIAGTKLEAEYTTDSWGPFALAFANAVAVPLQMNNTLENQQIIDDAAAALHTAISNLVAGEIEIVLEAIEPGVVIGLPGYPNLLAGLSLGFGAQGYVDASQGGDVRFNDGPGGPGTGATVDLLDGAMNIIETFTVVIYGDINGDANVDSTDAGILVDRENFIEPWNPVTEACFIKAADVNGDGNIDSIDAGLFVDCDNYLSIIDQTTGLAQPYL